MVIRLFNVRISAHVSAVRRTRDALLETLIWVEHHISALGRYDYRPLRSWYNHMATIPHHGISEIVVAIIDATNGAPQSLTLLGCRPSLCVIMAPDHEKSDAGGDHPPQKGGIGCCGSLDRSLAIAMGSVESSSGPSKSDCPN